MTTKNELKDELRQWLSNRLEEITAECDEEALPYQEDADNSYSEYHSIAVENMEDILSNFRDGKEFLEEVEDFIDNNSR